MNIWLKINFFLIQKKVIIVFANKANFYKVFGYNKLFETYNSLINLIWDPKKKIWKNLKLFGPKFEYLYPDLDYNQKEDIRSSTE